MPNYPVTISVDNKGNFTYRPATLRVVVPDSPHPEETIQWQYEGGAFAVHFPRSPFRRVVIQGHEQTDQGHGLIRRETAPGVYQYAVAVVRETDEGAKVFIDACPEVIIECG